jgi:hypothetical protein
MRWFFPVVSGALLAAILVGFSPTFFLRSLFDVPPMPAYLYVHGAVLTAWFVLVFAQTCLVAAHRVDLHRRLGVLTALVAVLVVPISTFVTLRAVPRLTAFGLGPVEIQNIVIGDLASLVFFSALVGTGLYLRRQPDVHKRLMIVSSLMFFGPVNSRLARLGFALPMYALLLLPLVVPAAYDLLVLRRLHRATMWIGLLVVSVWVVAGLVIASGAGLAFIDSLR